MTIDIQTLREKVRNHGIEYKGTANPTKAKCNNCDSTIKYDVLHVKGIAASAFIGVSDTLGTELYYCPNCGPNDMSNFPYQQLD